MNEILVRCDNWDSPDCSGKECKHRDWHDAKRCCYISGSCGNDEKEKCLTKDGTNLSHMFKDKGKG
jgi:hypothetical protein